jgi:hypothetical protein
MEPLLEVATLLSYSQSFGERSLLEDLEEEEAGLFYILQYLPSNFITMIKVPTISL